MRTKANLKAKEPVRIRTKQLSNGNQSLYLDIYQDGKRTYQFLKLYLVPASSIQAKQQNEETLRAAEAIKAQTILEITNGKAGLSTKNRGKMLLSDWMEVLIDRINANEKKGYWGYRQCSNLLIEYKGLNTRLCDVDKSFCLGFIRHLRTQYRKKNGELYKPTSAHNIFVVFSTALNEAAKAELIPSNPCTLVPHDEMIKVAESTKQYLTIEEVRRLIDTPCKNEMAKRAFLFSCFCGLRLSDIEALRWGDLECSGRSTMAKIIQKKTKKANYLPLSSKALEWLPDGSGREPEELVFTITSRETLRLAIISWCKQANISKHISFHSARHTFATMMLTLGADLYTTSKLLGHADVSTTQVYAKIIDKKKEEAVNLVEGLF